MWVRVLPGVPTMYNLIEIKEVLTGQIILDSDGDSYEDWELEEIVIDTFSNIDEARRVRDRLLRQYPQSEYEIRKVIKE